MSGGIIRDINTWCCNRNSTKCEEACSGASQSIDGQNKCKYGCSFWKDNPILPERCGENFCFTDIFHVSLMNFMIKLLTN